MFINTVILAGWLGYWVNRSARLPMFPGYVVLLWVVVEPVTTSAANPGYCMCLGHLGLASWSLVWCFFVCFSRAFALLSNLFLTEWNFYLQSPHLTAIPIMQKSQLLKSYHFLLFLFVMHGDKKKCIVGNPNTLFGCRLQAALCLLLVLQGLQFH